MSSVPSIDTSPGQSGDSSPLQSPRSASVSLQAAATLNAGLQRGEPVRRRASPSIPSPGSLSRNPPSPITGRRRSQILMNLQIADPTIPAPGEMVSESTTTTAAAGSSSSHRGASPHPVSASPLLTSSRDPYHIRTPSLGELHQELENEQEFQVNRLLSEIRRLQLQVQRQQQSSSTAIGDDVSGGGPDRSAPLPIAPSSGPAAAASSSSSQPPPVHHTTPTPGSLPRSPGFLQHPRSSFDLARADLNRRSRTPSRGASPRLRSTSISAESGEQWLLGGRDESAFYQAETQMLIRENQMLKHRIRELERHISESTGTASNASITHEPPHASHLNNSTSIAEENSSGNLSTAAD
ncbi:hypothetical protein B0T17DRAFT_488176 [Bombardia bombarda]|uniref:Uncharacterized protein n=1 Tax=Bombardia bombarda TaxID=252184 RepID=A0AA40C9Y8_9PEZI|nr:hypothetical protein B0T17DRAFT_488176 [Bombardia bombarda]